MRSLGQATCGTAGWKAPFAYLVYVAERPLVPYFLEGPEIQSTPLLHLYAREEASSSETPPLSGASPPGAGFRLP